MRAFPAVLGGMLALGALALPGCGELARAELPVISARAIRTLPHDPNAFTEGLFIADGALYESTGREGQSVIRREDIATGRVLASVSLPDALFGEGIAPWKGAIVSLTWRNGIGFRWDRASLAYQGRFGYLGEGWGMTSDGAGLIMSDGSDILRFIEPETFRVTRELPVTAEGRPLRMLNELEWVDGEILANVWMTDRIARIDPKSGHVVGWIDLGALHRKAGVMGEDDVANGIAWDAAHRRLYVTGKNWPVLFEIAPPKGR